jgi:hypothetical protein
MRAIQVITQFTYSGVNFMEKPHRHTQNIAQINVWASTFFLMEKQEKEFLFYLMKDYV